MGNKLLRSGSLVLSLALFAFIYVLLFQPQTLSITEVSCSGDKVWIKYSLADDAAKLASIIPDCASNPQGGWVGKVDFYADSYASGAKKTYYMTGYTATEDSSQKISCGTNQGGKEFAGATIPNDGIGSYFVTIKGTYYLKSEGYMTPHTFTYDEGKYISCILPSSTCEDGTKLRECSQKYKGKYCTASAYLVDKAGTCGCPEGQQAIGDFCRAIPVVTPDEPDSPITYNASDDTTSTADTNEDLPDNGDVQITVPTKIFGFDRNYVIVALAGLVVLINVARIKRWI